jgi:hypothetical protein
MCHSFRAEMRQSDSVQHHRQLLSFAKSGEQIIVLRSERLPFTDSESVELLHYQVAENVASLFIDNNGRWHQA